MGDSDVTSWWPEGVSKWWIVIGALVGYFAFGAVYLTVAIVSESASGGEVDWDRIQSGPLDTAIDLAGLVVGAIAGPFAVRQWRQRRPPT